MHGTALCLGLRRLLAAAGVAITFGVMGVINMAQREKQMIVAYTTFVVQEVILNLLSRSVRRFLMGRSRILLNFLVAGGIGVLIQRSIIRFLSWPAARPRCWRPGVCRWCCNRRCSAFSVRLTAKSANPPGWRGVLEPGQITTSKVSVSGSLCFAARCSLRHSARPAALWRRWGPEMRAVDANRRMAASMWRLRSRALDALTFGLGSGIAGIAGRGASQIDNVSPNLGQSYIIEYLGGGGVRRRR